MKKKIFISEKVTAIMLAAAMAISMTACGSPAKDMQGAAETAADEETSTVETAADRETSAVETVSEIAGNTTESTENAATDAEILVAEDPDTEIAASNENTDIKVTVEDQKEEKKNDAGEVLVTMNVQKATIEDSGYDALQKVLDQQSADTYELAQEAWGDMQAFLEDSDWETTGSLYAIEDTISMKRGDDRIFSYVTTDYSYLGGAHPNVVYNSYNYVSMPQDWVYKNLGLGGLRVWNELNGKESVEEERDEARQSICTSRSFAETITDIQELSARVSDFAAKCAEKLRQDGTAAYCINTFLYTNRFREDKPQDFPDATIRLDMPASSTQEVVSAALKALNLIWKPGFEYKKAGVVVFDIVNRDERQLTLFETDSAKKEKQDVLSQVMDNVNVSSGQNVLRVATQRPGHYADGIRREHASRLFSTDWDSIIEIH